MSEENNMNRWVGMLDVGATRLMALYKAMGEAKAGGSRGSYWERYGKRDIWNEALHENAASAKVCDAAVQLARNFAREKDAIHEELECELKSISLDMPHAIALCRRLAALYVRMPVFHRIEDGGPEEDPHRAFYAAMADTLERLYAEEEAKRVEKP